MRQTEENGNGYYTFIHEAIFGEKEQHRIFYYLMWENLQEVGYVITDESGYEIDSVFKAVALQNLVGEFAYRLYDTVNETDMRMYWSTWAPWLSARTIF